ncbi:MAG: methyltransferase [Candidatus Solibacter sp.]
MTPTVSPPQPWHRMAPALGSDAEFAAVRGLLAECGFTQERIFERLGISGPNEYKPVWLGGTSRPAATDALDALILLLMDGDFVPGETLERLLPAGGIAHLEALQLIGQDPQNPGTWFGGCTLFPTRGLLLASDRASSPDGASPAASTDMVYPPAIDGTVLFMSTLPETPCDAMMDLGTGSGIAALHGARYARHVWGTDIAPRSVKFAEFNRRLNGIENVTLLAGDMYAPVDGLTFDRIVTHPPCVPARKTEMIFRDGGEDGEQILRRCIEDAHRYLRPGGRLYTIATAADCEGEAFEDRVRLWLGTAAEEFDMVLVSHRQRRLKEVAVDSFLLGSAGAEDIRYRHQMWERRKTKSVGHFSLLLRRHETTRPAYTERVAKGLGFTQEHAEWVLGWGREVRDPEARGRLMRTRPRVSPHAEMRVMHRVHDGAVVPEVFTLSCRRPFNVERRLPPWLAQIVSQCNGELTWQEQLENAQEAGGVPARVTSAEFLTVLNPLVGQGLLWISERPLPGIAG